MPAEDRPNDRSPKSPTAVTELLSTLEPGDELLLNDRETPYEVVDVDTYSVRVVDDRGNELTVSQNLQTGGWNVTEPVWWAAREG